MKAIGDLIFELQIAQFDSIIAVERDYIEDIKYFFISSN